MHASTWPGLRFYIVFTSLLHIYSYAKRLMRGWEHTLEQISEIWMGESVDRNFGLVPWSVTQQNAELAIK